MPKLKHNNLLRSRLKLFQCLIKQSVFNIGFKPCNGYCLKFIFEIIILCVYAVLLGSCQIRKDTLVFFPSVPHSHIRCFFLSENLWYQRIKLHWRYYMLILQNISPPRRDEIFSPPINNPLKKSILPSFLKKILKNFLFMCSLGSDSPEISVLTDKIISPLKFILKN